ncbi:MAG: outer membrane protein assembly factor BamA [Bacteroidia bacterium]
MKKLILLILTVCSLHASYGQDIDSTSILILDYEKPTKYELGGIAVYGNQFTDRNIIVIMSGLVIGQQIVVPGDELRIATEKLWSQGLFSDIEIKLAGVNGKKIFINIIVTERPRLSKYSIRGLKKGETNDIRDELDLRRNQLITEDLINQATRQIHAFFYDKGYYGVSTEFTKEADPEKPNFEILRIKINKGKKVRVQDVVFVGNETVPDKKLRKLIKPKRRYRKINIFASSKYVAENYETTRPAVIAKYNSMGYRDAQLVSDSVIKINDKRVVIKMTIDEGKKYYFRDIIWVGNTKYRSTLLDTILGIKKGDVYDQARLETRLFMNPNGFDISSLYMDDGYLFFNVNPVEVLVENDSIDLELRVYEGKQATVNRVTVSGNDKTSDFVALRVIRTMPGDKFSRSDIQRSMRELAALGFFDPEGLDVTPIPNPANGTVDIEYKVVEKPSDQIEASGGWGGFGGFVGTLGLTLNNFSTRKMLQGKFNPIPTGDGQKLSLRAQSNGPQYQGYSFSFVEPWLGGKKPNSLSVSLFHSVQSDFSQAADRPKFKTTGGTISFGKRLKKPDDFFTFNSSLTYQRYNLNNWIYSGATELGFTTGFANNLSLILNLGRNSTSHPIYPSSGSNFNFSAQGTPPYSLLNSKKDYTTLTAQERFKWVELYKFKFDAQWFLGFSKNPNAKRQFVLAPAIRVGMVGIYNNDIGYSPFEQFLVGGSGLSNVRLYGTDIIAQRGYADGSISDPVRRTGSKPIYTKYTLELRYPLTVGQTSTIYAHTFLEAGNAYDNFKDFNPFKVRRAAGFGVRMFLPMFGLLGLDYAFPFDPSAPGEFHFTIGQQF